MHTASDNPRPQGGPLIVEESRNSVGRPAGVTLVVVAFLTLLLSSPPAASAHIAYLRQGTAGTPGSIWIMNDDGSGKRVLISGPAIGATYDLHEPFVDSRTGAVVFEHNGDIWKWRYGKLTKISSGASVDSGDSSALVNNTSPEISPGGTIVWERDFGITGPSSGHYEIARASLATGKALKPLSTPCSPIGSVDPSPNPRTGAIAYAGCGESVGLFPYNKTYALLNVAGAGRNVTWFRAEGSSLMDPSWDPSGTRIVVARRENTGRSSIWVVGRSSARRVFAPIPGWFSNPRFVGRTKIVFGYRTESGKSNIWSVAATCNSCTRAVQLTKDGISTDPAWTPIQVRRVAGAAAGTDRAARVQPDAALWRLAPARRAFAGVSSRRTGEDVFGDTDLRGRSWV